MVTYAALVWRRKKPKKEGKNYSCKRYRDLRVSVTGIMNTFPAAAMEVVVGLLPLHLQVRKEAVYNKAAAGKIL